MKPNAVIIPSCGSNLASLQFALERLGADVPLTEDAERIRAASHVILPGVGAAAPGMERLAAAGLVELIPTLTQPVLGICLGMQLLFARSGERFVGRHHAELGSVRIDHQNFWYADPAIDSRLLLAFVLLFHFRDD